jgi:hypothetical protein
MAFKDNKTVGEEVTSILRLAKVKLNESALKECGMDWQAPLDQQQEDRYNLTITTNDKTVTVSTTNPEDIIHMMKLGGVEVGAHSVEPATDIGYGSGQLTGLGLAAVPTLGTAGMEGEPAHDEPVGIEVLGSIGADDVDMGDEHAEHEAGESDDEEEAEHDEEDEDDEVEESGDWANSPDGSDGQQRSHGDIADQSAAGTGSGNKNYGQNKAPGQGDNPLAYESMMESYKKFKGTAKKEEKCSVCGKAPCECDDHVEEGVMDKVKAFGKKALDTLGHGDDEDMIKDLQRKAGVPVTGKKPEKKKEEKVEEGKKAKPDFLDIDKDGDKKEPMKKAVADKKKVKEAAKPDFLDIDKDGDKKEPMKKAVKDKKEKTNESAEDLAYMRKLAGLK